MNTSMLQRLNLIEDLPAFPEIVQKITTALSDQNVSFQYIADLISQDPIVAGKVLKLVNSAYYSRVNNLRIGSLPHAIARLGIQEVRNMVLTMSLFSMFPKTWKTINRQEFWKHCLTVAKTTKILYDFTKDHVEHPNNNRDTYYMAGLLHDLGIIILEQYFSPEFNEVVSECKKEGVPLHTIEEKRWGIDHGAIGAHLAFCWNLPDNIIKAIWFHHHPELADEDSRPIVHMVHLSDHVCNMQGLGPNLDMPAGDLNPDTIFEFNLHGSVLDEISPMVLEESTRSEIILSLAA